MNDERMNERDAVILGEYANCLEMPSLPDYDDKKPQTKELSIMAIGDKLKLMLTEFMENDENARLLEAAASSHLGKKLYSYCGIDCLPYESALQGALIDYTSKNGELKSMQDFRDIFGTQKGGARFLVYAVKVTDDKIYFFPTHLYEYNGKAFKTITLALKAAVKDYVSRTGKSINEVIKDFETIYKRLKWHPHVFKNNGDPNNNAGINYSPTAFNGLFVREDITPDKLRFINNILGDGFGISSDFKISLTSSRTRQLCDAMTISKDLMQNLLLMAGGRGGVGVGGGGSNSELTNWDGRKKKNGWGR